MEMKKSIVLKKAILDSVWYLSITPICLCEEKRKKNDWNEHVPKLQSRITIDKE